MSEVPDDRARDVVPPVAPLSIQAASVIRSIDALSTMFWVSIGGTILTVLFAGLNQLPGNVASEGSTSASTRCRNRSCRSPAWVSRHSSSG